MTLQHVLGGNLNLKEVISQQVILMYGQDRNVSPRDLKNLLGPWGIRSV